MESNVCKKPALAGVCAAQRQIFGPLRGPKIETLSRLPEKSLDFFDSLRGGHPFRDGRRFHLSGPGAEPLLKKIEMQFPRRCDILYHSDR